MRKHILLLAFLAFGIRAQEPAMNIPLPVPVTITHTSSVLSITANRPLEQCVVVTKMTNGFGRKLLREAIHIHLSQPSGEPLPDGHTLLGLDSLELSPEELTATALSLGKTWKPQSSEDELSIILTGFLRKLGARLMPEEALGPWVSQVLPSMLNRINQTLPPQ